MLLYACTDRKIPPRCAQVAGIMAYRKRCIMTQCRAPVQRDVTLSRGKCWPDLYMRTRRCFATRLCQSDFWTTIGIRGTAFLLYDISKLEMPSCTLKAKEAVSVEYKSKSAMRPKEIIKSMSNDYEVWLSERSFKYQPQLSYSTMLLKRYYTIFTRKPTARWKIFCA